MEIFNHYVFEVGRHLPEKIRVDIETEISSLLEDTLADRSQASGRQPDVEMAVEVLKEFGPPQKMAASYLPEKYLIGPQLYPIFILVVRIVLIVIAVITLIGWGVSLTKTGLTPLEISKSIINAIIGYVTAALQNLGNIVLIFAIIQWTLPNIKVKIKDWDPRTLKPSQPTHRVNIAEYIWDIIFTIGIMLLFNVYPQWVGIGSLTNGQWTFFPILTAQFFTYLPWLNLLWMLSLVRDGILLRQSKWTPVTSWFSAALNVFTIIIIVAILSGAPVLSVDSSTLAAQGFDLTKAAQLSEVLSNVAKVVLETVLIVMLIVEAVHLAKTLYWRIRSNTRSERIPPR